MKNKKKILILGIDSFIGNYIKKKISKQFIIYGTTNKKSKLNSKTFFLDLKKPNLKIIKKEFDVILICAGKNNLKFCQDNFKEANKINYLGLKKIIQKSLHEGIFIIFLSSNLVFNGLKKLYETTETPSPKSNYGKLKLKVENFLKKHSKKNFCILRLTKVYSKKVGLIPYWKKKIKLKQTIDLNCSFKISPLPIDYISKYIIKIIKKKICGIYHLSNKKEFTLKEFFFKKLGKYENLVINNNTFNWRNTHNCLKVKLP